MVRNFAQFVAIAGALTFGIGAQAVPPNWVGSWATSQQIPEARNALAPDDLKDATLRQVVHLSLGGERLRIRISNAFGTAPLHIASAHIARPGNAPGTIDVLSDKALSFSGRPDVILPAGADFLSDPVAFHAPAYSDLAITLHFDEAPAQQTSHPGSRETSFLVHGDQAIAPQLQGAQTFEHWFQIAGVDVEAPTHAASIVTLGDSITDGHGATTNANDRWPDDLARRLEANPATKSIGVLNQGIGGNRLLLDGLGPNALSRFDRDVLAQSGVKYLIVLEGINDLGTLTRDAPVPPEKHRDLVARIISAYQQMIDRAHARSIKIYGATILPDGGSDYYHPDASNEADRQAVNAWIRAPGHFDGVVDFDAAVRDPQNPDHMLAAYDSGDHLHPSPAGYRAMADAIPLTYFGASGERKPATHKLHSRRHR